MTVTTGARGSCSCSASASASSRNASGSSSLAASAVWPISSTTIIAVSWSSCWLIVTIWPSFISCLMTSDAFTDILWARSATEIVSGMCTSCAWNSAGGVNVLGAPSLRSPRRPARGARQPARPAPGGAARRGLERALLGGVVGPARRELLRLDRLLVARLGDVGAAVPGAPAFLWIVPLIASFGGSAGLASSGFLATSTFFGADIMLRIAAASSSAALRRLARSSARCFSSFSTTAALTTRNAGFAGSAAARSAAAGFAAAARQRPRRRLGAARLGRLRRGFGRAASCAAALRRRACSALRARLALGPFLLLLALRCALLRQLFFLGRSSSACACASSSRRRSSASLRLGGAASSTAGAASSRLTKVRFLRTSTWIVRALPLESACLISLVDLRVSVIFLRSPLAAVPCDVRR